MRRNGSASKTEREREIERESPVATRQSPETSAIPDTVRVRVQAQTRTRTQIKGLTGVAICFVAVKA